MREIALLFSVFLVCCLFSGHALGGDDPLEVLWITDDSWIRHDAQFLRKEPMVDALLVICRRTIPDQLTRLEVLRTVRRYFPRTYEKLVGNYEFIVLKSMEIAHFTQVHLEWMRKAIEEEGLGGLTEMYIARSSYLTPSAWAESPLSTVFPNDAGAVVGEGEGYDLVKGSFELIVNDDPTLPPVLTRYSDYMFLEYWYEAFRYMLPKEGARTYAWAKTDTITRFTTTRKGIFDYLLGWQYGKGYTWSLGGISGAYTWWSGEYERRIYLGGDAFFAMLG